MPLIGQLEVQIPALFGFWAKVLDLNCSWDAIQWLTLYSDFSFLPTRDMQRKVFLHSILMCICIIDLIIAVQSFSSQMELFFVLFLAHCRSSNIHTLLWNNVPHQISMRTRLHSFRQIVMKCVGLWLLNFLTNDYKWQTAVTQSAVYMYILYVADDDNIFHEIIYRGR